MTRKILVAAAMTVAMAGTLTGCGGSGSGTPAASVAIGGTVADGYLSGAQVFLDKNGNYQPDPGEPSTTTDANGTYSLNVAPEDIGKYPIIAVAIKDKTIDLDNGQPVPNSYLLSIPPTAVSGTVNNFISPMSSLLREKMEANPGMTMAQAMTQLRNQLNLQAGLDMLGDYMAGSRAGQSYQTQYQAMHKVAQQMAGLMANQGGLVMNGSGANRARYRSMMGLINQNLPQIAGNATQGMGMTSSVMTAMQTRMQTMLAAISPSSGFGNYSSMFRNMTSHQYFWNYSGTKWQPTGGMMGSGLGMMTR